MIFGLRACWHLANGKLLKIRSGLAALLCMITILAVWLPAAAGEGQVRIHGRVTDFNGTPQEGVAVHLKDENFKNLYSVFSGKDGSYEVMVDRGVYFCMYAIRESEYRNTRLEYWAWNVPALAELEINPQYERLEIYAMNAFKPQVTPHETFMVYFRPMSLSKQLLKKSDAKPGDLLDIAPTSLDPQDLDLQVNGLRARVVSVNKVKEYARGFYLFGYVVQAVAVPGNAGPITGYDQITLTVKDPETGDTGKADCFLPRYSGKPLP